MKVEDLNNWEEFEEALALLENDLTQRCERSGLGVSDPIFRGHENQDWKLETTLERFFSRAVSLAEYFEIVRKVKPQIEAVTGTNWDAPTTSEYEEFLQSTERYIRGEYPALSYFAYLRHHGFPSPLLDWTASPYVAAFFAFREPPQQNVNRISIYSYVEYAGEVKEGAGGDPYIQVLEKSLKTHKRHFAQQSRYTICTVFRDCMVDGRRVRDLYYGNHEEVVVQDAQAQDLLWKFTLPVEERRKVLARLRRMNITAYSLLGSEDSLLETIATNDVFLDGLTSSRRVQRNGE